MIKNMKYYTQIKNLFLLSIVVLLLISGHKVYSQNEFKNNSPQLNDHYFTPIKGIPGPFINSNFGSNLGIAFSDKFENIIIEIDGEPLIGLEGSLLFANLDFEYQQKIKDWIAINVQVGMTARLGTELQSMLTQGVNTITAFKLGWLFKLAKGKKYMLSGTAQINNYNGTFISIGDFIESIVKDSTVTSISKKVPSLNATIGLRYAYGFNDMCGIQFDMETGFGESFERGTTSFVYNFGGLLDVNLANRTKIPLGIVLSYQISSLPDYVYGEERSASIAGLKIAYTGAPNFNLGLEVTSSNLPVRNVDEKVRSTGILITTKYFFN